MKSDMSTNVRVIRLPSAKEKDDRRRFLASLRQEFDLDPVLANYEKIAVRFLESEPPGSKFANEAQDALHYSKMVADFIRKGETKGAVYVGMLLEQSMMRLRKLNENRSGLWERLWRGRRIKKRAIEIFKQHRKVRPHDRIGAVVDAVHPSLKQEGHTVAKKTLREWLAPLMPAKLRTGGPRRKTK